MHGSLLPKYRGRVPVNWAIIHGETETGATLHYMTEKPDAGDIVAQRAVPILPDDTARDVFDKVTQAAATLLEQTMPALAAGTAPRMPQDLSRGSYFGGRRPDDGLIDWSMDAASIHNLVRAVAPPYPGARTTLGGRPARVLRTRVLDADHARCASACRRGRGHCRPLRRWWCAGNPHAGSRWHRGNQRRTDPTVWESSTKGGGLDWATAQLPK